MPVIVAPAHYDTWLAATDLAIPKALLEDPYPVAKMRAHPVGRRIGNPKNDDAELIVEVQSQPGATRRSAAEQLEMPTAARGQ